MRETFVLSLTTINDPYERFSDLQKHESPST